MAATATQQSAEQRDLSLIGKVEMRIALADSDLKLETILKTYLAPLLLKLASEYVNVRNKVISVCQHVNTRTKPATVRLPVLALIKQFKENENAMIRHFDLFYIQQGVDRLSTTEKSELVPVVVSGVAASGRHGPQIFNLFTRLLEAFPLPPRGTKEDVELRHGLKLTGDDASYLASWLGKLILFQPQKPNTSSPGLTLDEQSFLSLEGKEEVWTQSSGGLNLLRSKVLAAKLLASGMFDNGERFLPALFASADPASTISNVGDDMLKRAMPATDLEDEALVQRLFALYFGEDGTTRVKAPLRLKILGLLNKSKRSLTFANKIMKIADDGVTAERTADGDVVMSGTQNSNEGRETMKLRAAIFQYINFAARHGQKDTLHAIAPTVISRLRDFIENQGWPKPGGNEDLVSRAYAYEVIGLLAKAGPRSLLYEEDIPILDLLQWLFKSLAEDGSGNSIVVSIEESLSTVLSALALLDARPAEQDALEDLLIDQMSLSADRKASKRIRSTRYVTLRFANRCLPYNSVKARWIDILGIGAVGDRAEVHEEAERGLSPYWYRMLNGSNAGIDLQEIRYPSFSDVMTHFFSGRTVKDDLEPFAVAQQAQRSFSSCFAEMTNFARRMLYQQAMSDASIAIVVDSEWERRIDAAVEADEQARKTVRQYTRREDEDLAAALKMLLSALFVGLTEHMTGPDNKVVELLSLFPNSLLEGIVLHLDSLMRALKVNDHSRRMAAARAFGILASHPTIDIDRAQAFSQQLISFCEGWETAVGSITNQVHGAMTALGFYFSRSSCRGQDAAKSSDYRKFVPIVVRVLADSRDASLQEAAYISLGQLCMFGAVTPEMLEQSMSIPSIVEKLYATAKEGNEASITSLGQLSMILSEDHEALPLIEENLHKLHEIRQAEVHFTVGEALSYLASGWQSSALATKLDVDAPQPIGPSRSHTLARLVDRVLSDCGTTKPALKKAAVIWLLCLVQFSGETATIQSRLHKCQAAFKRCLSDRDELIQESASRGLGLVYEKGDRSLKDELVRDLVSSFSSDRQSQLAGTVSADTQLFEPGALPTGDGSVSTYKDIMSLASEVGDSSLVYKFMSMASSNAIWSSRAAFGRFGLSNVLSDFSVDGYLATNPKLYPKLYRYRFDPNSGVQRSMNDIWNALVKDSAATIDKYFDEIMTDLLASILAKEWRVRQASCAALADLVQGRPLERYEDYIERIWTQCFKVLDDIKESVRAAAGALARVLTGILTRALETDHSSNKNAVTMLKHVLPFLLSTSGMESSAKEVQAFSVHTLLEIIKKGNGKTLRPSIPELIERLIGSLSSFEPEEVNYLHLNASKYNLTEQKIDDMRLTSIRSSPLMEAIERCLDLLDDETMTILQPRLEAAMKSAVGLPSKVGCSRILVSLSTRRLAVFRPHADSFLRVIEKVVLDRNETVSSSYAMAAGYVARAASDKQILRLLDFSRRLYFESESDRESATPRRSITAGELVSATAKHANDRFKALSTSILPFVYVGKHDPNEQVSEQFQNAWNESVGGSRAVLLYLSEIVELCQKHLDSPQWVLKHTAARAVADAVNTVALLESPMSTKTADVLWPALEKALAGKTWEGKEVVLTAFVKWVESAKAYYSHEPPVASNIEKIVIREAKRQNAAYRPHAIEALASICRARADLDMATQVFDIAEPLLLDAADGEPMEIDGESVSTNKEEGRQKLLAAAITALFSSLNHAVSNEETLRQQIGRVVADVAALSSPTPLLWRAIYESLTQLFERLHAQDSKLSLDADAEDRLKALFFRPALATEALRLLRANALTSMSKLASSMVSRMRPEILALLKEEQAKPVLESLNSALAPPQG